MDRQYVVDQVAEYFGVFPEDEEHADENSYDFQSGCSMGIGRMWLTLGNVVNCIMECIVEED